MKVCKNCKDEIRNTAKWYYKYDMCKSCVAKLKKEGKLP